MWEKEKKKREKEEKRENERKRNIKFYEDLLTKTCLNLKKFLNIPQPWWGMLATATVLLILKRSVGQGISTCLVLGTVRKNHCNICCFK